MSTDHAQHITTPNHPNQYKQAVLEGLNSLLDHRHEVYLPELGQAFRAGPGFRVFATQNPLGQVSMFDVICVYSYGALCLSHTHTQNINRRTNPSHRRAGAARACRRAS